MTAMLRFKITETVRWLIYLSLSIILFILSLIFLLWGVGYMERGLIATSLLSALTGFTLLSASLYTLRLSAYVYALSKGEGIEKKS